MSRLKLSKPIRLRPDVEKRPARAYSMRQEGDYSHIDHDTRLFVWNRDGGQCRYCTRQEDLQFDHIIPRSKGGSGKAVNVELLCGTCNRRKSASLFPPVPNT